MHPDNLSLFITTVIRASSSGTLHSNNIINRREFTQYETSTIEHRQQRTHWKQNEVTLVIPQSSGPAHQIPSTVTISSIIKSSHKHNRERNHISIWEEDKRTLSGLQRGPPAGPSRLTLILSKCS